MAVSLLRFILGLVFPVRVTVEISKRPGFSKEWESIVRKYGLWQQVEMRKDWRPPKCRFTLFRVIEREEDRELPLPPCLIEEIKEIVLYYHRAKTIKILGVLPEFQVVAGMTVEEIKKAQQEWHNYCEMFWIGAGG